MTCPKLLLALMATAVQAAPQISRSRPVARRPLITSNNLGQASSSFSAPSTFGRSTFSAPSSFGNSFSGLSSSFGNSFSTPALSLPRLPSSPVSSQLFSTASRQPFRVEENYGPASYNFDYKVADNVAQTYIAQSESRDSKAVTGNYNYVDPNGSLVTVNYRADEGGFKQERTVQEGAVNIRNTIGAPSQNFVSQPINSFVSQPINSFVSRPNNNFVSRPNNNFVSRPNNNFVSRPNNNFVSRPTTNFVSRPSNFGTSGQGRLFNSRPAGGFSATRGSSFPTTRG